MKNKYLLVTADDCGMCHSINLGTFKAWREGIVGSSNLMAPCPWFYEATLLAKKYRLPVGVHLTLTCEWDLLRWGPLTPGKSLKDSLGYFYPSFEDLEKQAKEHEIYEEYKAQILRVKSHGIEPSHIDTHMLSGNETTVGAGIVPIVKKVARDFGLIYTYAWQDGKHKYFDEVHGVSLKSEASLITWLRGLKPGCYHAIGHAAVKTVELGTLCSAGYAARFIDTRPKDLAIFTSPAVKKAVAANGIELLTIAKLLKISKKQ